MALLVIETAESCECSDVLLALSFTWSKLRQRWECYDTRREHEQKVKELLPEFTVGLSRSEQLTLHLSPLKDGEAKQAFWVASSITGRNFDLTTTFREDTAEADKQAAIEEIKAKGLSVDNLRLAVYLQKVTS